MPPLPALETGHVIKIVFYAAVFIGSLVGNVGVIVIVATSRRMRSAITAYLVNLAVADISILLLCMWVHLVQDISRHRHYPLGAFWCRFNGFAQMTALTASVLTLTAIACDRFVAVMFPLRARRSQTGRRVGIIIAGIWVVSMAAALPLLIHRHLLEIQWKNAIEYSCQDNWPTTYEYNEEAGGCLLTQKYKHMYQTLVAVALFFAPIAVMGGAYTLIVWRLWLSPFPSQGMESQIHQSNGSKKRVVKMVVLVMVVFVVCWLPLQVISLYSMFAIDTGHSAPPSWFESVHFLAYFMAYSNSLWNPILYGGFNASFRQGFVRLFLCRRPSFSRGFSRSRDKNGYTAALVHLMPHHGTSSRRTQMTTVR
ncbi:substance-P receptor-like [Amphibalanus amphitrite]|uniref:substance-P receptor-like n=1 Tax=Amphibalanus amphitrite TaxID=1232801 RepID=UPI001C8FAD3A|nr:substance-P receptor-like [Amphibalanus amphitrite]